MAITFQVMNPRHLESDGHTICHLESDGHTICHLESDGHTICHLEGDGNAICHLEGDGNANYHSKSQSRTHCSFDHAATRQRALNSQTIIDNKKRLSAEVNAT